MLDGVNPLKSYPRNFLAIFAAAVGVATPHGRADNWPQLRGNGAMGVAVGASLPDTWSAEENVAWKVPISGMGWSSPVVWGDRVFLTTAISSGEVEEVKEGLYFGGERKPTKDEHEWRVLCLDLKTGETRWQRSVHKGVPPGSRHRKNSFASETPVTDGERVYAYIGNIGLFVFDMDGRPLWDRKWQPVKTRYGWGTASSPVLHAGRIYIVNDNEGQSFLTALDKNTGKDIWKKNRDEGSNWSPPFVWENKLRTEIVTTGTGMVRSYDLDGEVLWTLSGMSSITVPSPFAQGDLLYLGSGYVGDRKKPWFAIRPGASGDISLGRDETSSEFVAWCEKTGAPYMPTPVLYQGRLYVLLDRGLLSCYDAKTGDLVYGRQRLGKSAGFTASPLASDGKIYCFGERGETVVIAAGEEFEMLHRNELGELIMATPAIAGGSLLIRTSGHLYCIRKKEVQKAAHQVPDPHPAR